ncbi:unnamed protein product [Owenia fusiformis]|uniref:L-Fucosyltransferase n=1 Tax=Owenia fusiformis TaxID=6347 RepID=A0A8J1T6W3_OWEFU|nr:unnamed protein product [Owenia fusiformis]
MPYLDQWCIRCIKYNRNIKTFVILTLIIGSITMWLGSTDFVWNSRRTMKFKWIFSKNIGLTNYTNDAAKAGQVKKHISENATYEVVRGPGYVSVQTLGRLGNNMFQFAAVIVIAKHNKMMPNFPKGVLDKIFNIDRTILSNKINKTLPTLRLQEKRASAYDKNVMRNISRNTNVRICCYFQSWKYWTGIQEELKKEFTFNTEIDTTAKNFIDQHRNMNQTSDLNVSNIILVGIHIRRTDMAKASENRRGYLTAPKEYFQNAMQYFRNKHRYVRFIVCTDDIKWAKNNIQAPNVTFSIGHGSGVDLAILSHCNHTIMSTGTFSWWAAWLANGEVIYWAGWPKPNTEIGRTVEPSDYFLPHWKAMI